jgi:drug/metabolite transporter (DMT)-like permease
VALNGDAAWIRLVALTVAALGAALTERPGPLGNYLVGASLVIGAAISSTILMLP